MFAVRPAPRRRDSALSIRYALRRTGSAPKGDEPAIENKVATSSAKSFLSKMVGFSVATWISFLLSFFSAPITTRLFVPDEMGRINLFTTFLNLFMMFAYLGLDQA